MACAFLDDKLDPEEIPQVCRFVSSVILIY